MKVIKAKIEVIHPDATSTTYVGYPAVWMDNKDRIVAILDANRNEETIENGRFYKHLVVIVPDDLFDLMIANPLFSVPTRAEVVAQTATNMPKKQVVNDEQKILQILVKNVKGEALTKADKDAIDPTKPDSGVVMTKDFIDFCNDYGVNNIN